MKFTLGSMYWVNPKYSLDDLREDMRRIRGNRLTLLRTFIPWEYVETGKNRFDFSMYDRFFQAEEEYGIGLMPTLLFYLPFHRVAEMAEILARCNGYPAAVRNRFGKGTAELWGTALLNNPEADPSALLLRFAGENGVKPGIRIGSGDNVITSLLIGEDTLLAVFTSLSGREQKVTAELPFDRGEILNEIPSVFHAGAVEFTLRPNETVPLLIRFENG